jgi:hypothetical protein
LVRKGLLDDTEVEHIIDVLEELSLVIDFFPITEVLWIPGLLSFSYLILV